MIGASPAASGAEEEKWPSGWSQLRAPASGGVRKPASSGSWFEEYRLNAGYVPARCDVIPVDREIVTVQRFRGAS